MVGSKRSEARCRSAIIETMKFGMRTPSLKKSLSARTKGRVTRAIKRKLIPGYGKPGMGYIKDPERAVKNKIYRKTTFGIRDLFK